MFAATNIFDYFDETRAAHGEGAPWSARVPRRPQPTYDLKLAPRVPSWREDAASLEALERIEAQPWVGSVIRRGNEVRVRLADSWIQMAGATLEAGGGAEVTLSDLVQGRRFAVQFWDANATKALHVGHLRNLALGNALASALTQAGGQVERRSVISDAGRSMGEAMAGVLQSGRHQQSWPDAGHKSDHFVGLCYADYVAAGGFADEGLDGREDSLAREILVQDDSADQLLKRVMEGEEEALELWFKTRAWVIAGQRKTLARLGISFDQVFFESDFLKDGAELTEQGLREGKLQRRADGVVVYGTGFEHIQEMPLVRADGQTTQLMRAVSYWMGAPGLEGVTTVQITGTEWVAHSECIHNLMTELTPAENGGSRRGVHPTHDIFHGMVASQKRAIGSSDEGALLIDDLIEQLDTRIDSDPQMREVRRTHPFPEQIPAQVALGYFLPHPIAARVDFDPNKLLRVEDSLGWEVACARARQGAPDTPLGPRPAEDLDYRFAVVQSELYRRHLRIAVNRFDVAPLAHYLRYLARWYLQCARSEGVERVVHTLLDRGARGLGLEAGR